jgi:hypothetical protein
MGKKNGVAARSARGAGSRLRYAQFASRLVLAHHASLVSRLTLSVAMSVPTFENPETNRRPRGRLCDTSCIDHRYRGTAVNSHGRRMNPFD